MLPHSKVRGKALPRLSKWDLEVLERIYEVTIVKGEEATFYRLERELGSPKIVSSSFKKLLRYKLVTRRERSRGVQRKHLYELTLYGILAIVLGRLAQIGEEDFKIGGQLQLLDIYLIIYSIYSMAFQAAQLILLLQAINTATRGSISEDDLRQNLDTYRLLVGILSQPSQLYWLKISTLLLSITPKEKLTQTIEVLCNRLLGPTIENLKNGLKISIVEAKANKIIEIINILTKTLNTLCSQGNSVNSPRGS